MILNGMGGDADCNDLILGGTVAEAGGSLHIGALSNVTARNGVQVGYQAGPALLQVGVSGELSTPGDMFVGTEGLVRGDRGAYSQSAR